MQLLLFVLEIIGTVAFAISGAITGLRKNMDIFGVVILGLTTAVGGGIIRDIIIGSLPPAVFLDPIYAIVAIGTSLVFFLSCVRRLLMHNRRVYDLLLLLSDSVGLGAFTVIGVAAAWQAGYGGNIFLAVFLGTVTGVGGGVLRDILAGNTPYIFVKHIYACASLFGALLCSLLWSVVGSKTSMLSAILVVVVIRMLAAHFRWSLPKANDIDQTQP